MQESNGDGRLANLPGVYRHEESGKEITAVNEQQADGFVRMGYKYHGEAKSKAEVEATKQAEAAAKAPEFEQPAGTGPVGATEKVQGDVEADTIPANDDQTDIEKAKEQVPNVVGKEDKKESTATKKEGK